MTVKQHISRRRFLKRSSLLSLTSATTIGSLGLGGLLNTSSALAATSDYKALVFVFLAGGNDSFNMIVPKGDGPLRDQYQQGRRTIAIPAEQLHTLDLVTAPQIYGGENYAEFGMHPACADLATLFNDQEMSVLCNIGNLNVPTTREQFLDKSVSLPEQLFSHSDQQRQFQSDPSTKFTFGWGGRAAELLTSYNTGSVSPLISVSGLNSFQVTKNSVINPYVMSSTGLTKLDGYNGQRQTMLENAFDSVSDSDHLMVQKYRDVFSSARGAQTIIGSAFNQADANGVDYDSVFSAADSNNTKTSKRLKTIAKMIAGRESTGNNRPVFFVQVNGFDTHQNLLADHSLLMSELNDALKGFRDALVAQGDFDKVLTFVGSEFGRTFTPNGDSAESGTDHAWGGHALVMGNMVNGGQFFGTHPDLKLAQGLDASTGRGRWVPTTATSQCGAVIAKWLGVQDSDLNQLFPSLDNFPSPFDASENLTFIKGA
ncbi:DUF1501 domain-containing protein [Thalassotalea sp. PLHSN55]|uniref:DUF1501 domain-containing protein n=1 Tax=Thalassotalea sp. PLHSN55 TaxID=3435888 RepID=UPI003F82E35D